MPDVLFPEFVPAWEHRPPRHHRYYRVYFRYWRKLFERAGLTVELVDPEQFKIKNHPEFIFFGKRVIVDISDFVEPVLANEARNYDAIFKMHFERCGFPMRFRPVAPLGVVTWTQYDEVRKLEYEPTDKVISNQLLFGNRLNRGRWVRAQLSRAFPDLDVIFHRQVAHWKNLLQAGAVVCIPGAREDILDRGQMEAFGLGVCTISPELRHTLPWHKRFLPCIHYVACKPDFSDVCERVRWCLENPDLCKRIGESARDLFDECCLPGRQVEWMRACLGLSGGVKHDRV